MLNRDDLKTWVTPVATPITTGDANVGSAIPQNMRRFIYAIKAINLHTGANLLTLGKRENGEAVTTTAIDYIQFSTQYETQKDPDELKEDSAPLYIIEGAGTGGASYMRAVVGSGTAYLTIWYIDAPA
ncbi:hypothetical protein ES703_35378 [subsurface metagenome]|jgi:hypothetical protein